MARNGMGKISDFKTEIFVRGMLGVGHVGRHVVPALAGSQGAVADASPRSIKKGMLSRL
jgi:hypothetical protein